MKTLLSFIIGLTFTTVSSAGITGWITSETRDWRFIQTTGGLRVGAPVEKDGKKMLPITYDVSGLTTVTCEPTTGNSGLAVRKIEAVGKNGNIVIRVVTQLVEKTSLTGSQHFSDLTGLPRGSYEVYYESAGSPEKHLSRIEIK